MYKKLLSVMVVVAMVATAFVVLAAQSNVQAKTDDLIPNLGTTNVKITDDSIAAGDGSSYSSAGASASKVIVSKTFLALDTYYGNLVPTVFDFRGSNDNCEVWVAEDNSFPVSDPLGRNSDPSRLTITDDMVTMIMAQFSSIYATEAKYFGEPTNRLGTDTVSYGGDTFDGFPTTDGQKVMIMIFNIHDGSYYDPNTYTTYTVGFFSSGIDNLYDRNIIHLDCWRWADRTGVQPDTPGYYSYLYEATVAHEYQHLLHNDFDPDESTWLNEGCSMYAEMLCGYGVPYDYLNSFLYYPDNSLTVWGDQGDNLIIGDYGAAAMFMIYLNDKYGGSATISALVHSTLHSTDSVTKVLKKLGYHTTFDGVFENFRLANILRSTVASSKYGYTSLDYSKLVNTWTYNYDVSYGVIDRTDLAYVSGYGIDAYGTDYWIISGSNWDHLKKSQYKFYFDGQDTVKTGWQAVNVDGTDYMWSGMGDMADFWLKSNAMTLSGGSHTFSFDTIVNIEDQYDFGFVQYSTDGVTWTSIANGDTTATTLSDVTAIQESLPGLTGYSNGEVHETFTFNLPETSTVYLRLRYMTDEGTNGSPDAGLNERVGWLATNFALDSSSISLPNSNSVDNDIDYLITIYGQSNGYRPMVKLYDMNVNDRTSIGSIPLSMFSNYKTLIVVVSPTNGPCSYEFGVMHK